MGTTSLNGTDGNAVKVNVTRVIPHPLFNPVMLDFDVAVLELASPLVFNKYIQPVCLPLAAQKFPVGKKCVISGWGDLEEGNGKQRCGTGRFALEQRQPVPLDPDSPGSIQGQGQGQSRTDRNTRIRESKGTQSTTLNCSYLGATSKQENRESSLSGTRRDLLGSPQQLSHVQQERGTASVACRSTVRRACQPQPPRSVTKMFQAIRKSKDPAVWRT